MVPHGKTQIKACIHTMLIITESLLYIKTGTVHGLMLQKIHLLMMQIIIALMLYTAYGMDYHGMMIHNNFTVLMLIIILSIFFGRIGMDQPGLMFTRKTIITM